MKAMFLGFGVAILIAVGAAVVLETMQMSSAQRYATESVRF